MRWSCRWARVCCHGVHALCSQSLHNGRQEFTRTVVSNRQFDWRDEYDQEWISSKARSHRFVQELIAIYDSCRLFFIYTLIYSCSLFSLFLFEFVCFHKIFPSGIFIKTTHFIIQVFIIVFLFLYFKIIYDVWKNQARWKRSLIKIFTNCISLIGHCHL